MSSYSQALATALRRYGAQVIPLRAGAYCAHCGTRIPTAYQAMVAAGRDVFLCEICGAPLYGTTTGAVTGAAPAVPAALTNSVTGTGTVPTD